MMIRRGKSLYFSCARRLGEKLYGDNIQWDLEWPSSRDEEPLNQLINRVNDRMDHEWLNESLPELAGSPPTLLALIRWIERESPEGCSHRLVANGEWAGVDAEGYFIGKSFQLSALHRHHNPQLSEKENQELYGKCSGLHGHSYGLDLELRSRSWEDLLDQMDNAMNRWVEPCLEPLRGSYLNDFVGNTSGERICQYLGQRLKQVAPDNARLHVTLRETRKNSFRLL